MKHYITKYIENGKLYAGSMVSSKSLWESLLFFKAQNRIIGGEIID